MKSLRTITLAVAASLLISIVFLRIAVPSRIDGDWTGPLTECLCKHRNLLRFEHGHVIWYGHGGEPTKLKDWGTYRKVGRSTYEWSSPKHPVTIVRVGWFFSSYQRGFLNHNELFYCWRYPFPWRAEKLFHECEMLTQENQ
jgi:hypothetical protein